MPVLANADFSVGEFLLWLVWIFLFVIWFWLLITIFSDLFRRHDINGWVKALWIIFVGRGRAKERKQPFAKAGDIKLVDCAAMSMNDVLHTRIVGVHGLHCQGFRAFTMGQQLAK